MTATNLDLVGRNKWGQLTSRRLYSDDSGQMCVMVQPIGTVRRTPMPYRDYARSYMSFSYIMERS